MLTTINDLFGIDITGGYMGERDPVTAGYLVLILAPAYLLAVVRCIREFCIASPIYLSLSNAEFQIHQGKKEKIAWFHIEYIRFDIEENSEKLVVGKKDGTQLTVPITFLCSDIAELRSIFSNHFKRVD